ncbi:hypothetical protein G8767_20820 [Rhodococcus sp. IC4_135]|uniref:hypothetical protein n=1 Tax=Rhodococcus sp. IC4_135 TaxID=2715537 RepID=UPI00142198E7|nr:hypothetical protein [Rhodococcus sp. IC4_135]
MSAPYAECDLDAIVAGVQRQWLQYPTLQLDEYISAGAIHRDVAALSLNTAVPEMLYTNPSPVAAPSSAGAGIPAASEGHPTPLAAT